MPGDQSQTHGADAISRSAVSGGAGEEKTPADSGTSGNIGSLVCLKGQFNFALDDLANLVVQIGCQSWLFGPRRAKARR